MDFVNSVLQKTLLIWSNEGPLEGLTCGKRQSAYINFSASPATSVQGFDKLINLKWIL